MQNTNSYRNEHSTNTGILSNLSICRICRRQISGIYRICRQNYFQTKFPSLVQVLTNPVNVVWYVGVDRWKPFDSTSVAEKKGDHRKKVRSSFRGTISLDKVTLFNPRRQVLVTYAPE